MKDHEMKEFLDEQASKYNAMDFIELDPILIPHGFSKREDIEISAFFSAIIAWGQRPSIIKNARSLMERMEESPHDFVMNASNKDLKNLDGFVHRTFNAEDAKHFVRALRAIYQSGGLENLFLEAGKEGERNYKNGLISLRETFFQLPHEQRTQKHIANPEKGSSAKRLNMFLRWMVRKDKRGVDFGLWDQLSPSKLLLPLDVHTGNISRELGLLQRKQNDWKAVIEISERLRDFDPIDPIKYDFALFGIGVNGGLT